MFEKIKAKWATLDREKKVLVVALIVIAIIGLASSAKAAVVENLTGDWKELRYTGEDAICQDASIYGNAWGAVAQAWGLIPVTEGAMVIDEENGRVFTHWVTMADAAQFSAARHYVVFGYAPQENLVCIIADATRRGDPA